MKKLNTFVSFSLISTLLVIGSSLASTSSTTAAETCSTTDFSTLHLTPMTSSLLTNPNWKLQGKVNVITWADNATSIAAPTGTLETVTSKFLESEDKWIEEAFNSFGEVLDSVTFVKVSDPAKAKILIGYTKLTFLSPDRIVTTTHGGAYGIWYTNPIPNSTFAMVQFMDPSIWPKQNFEVFSTEARFVHALQNELINILGINDMDYNYWPSNKTITILDNSKAATYGQLSLNDFDASMIRQVYGESTCPSTYTTTARAANLANDKVLGDQFLAALNTPPTTTTLPPPTTTTTIKKTVSVTITCVKGKLVKKVTAVKPVCPAGYKKK